MKAYNDDTVSMVVPSARAREGLQLRKHCPSARASVVLEAASVFVCLSTGTNPHRHSDCVVECTRSLCSVCCHVANVVGGVDSEGRRVAAAAVEVWLSGCAMAPDACGKK